MLGLAPAGQRGGLLHRGRHGGPQTYDGKEEVKPTAETDDQGRFRIAIPRSIDVSPVSGERERVCGNEVSGLAKTIWVTRPGSYRVSIPPIEGYRPVAPFDVDILPGQLIEREVSLQR